LVDTGLFVFEESTMAKTRGAYPPEFRRQMVELVHAGRTPEELAHEFEPTAQSIRNWVAQWERNAGRGDGGLTTAEREEFSRLRRENRQLRLEREILSKALRPLRQQTFALKAYVRGDVPVGSRLAPGNRRYHTQELESAL
jgi:transposase